MSEENGRLDCQSTFISQEVLTGVRQTELHHEHMVSQSVNQLKVQWVSQDIVASSGEVAEWNQLNSPRLTLLNCCC